MNAWTAVSPGEPGAPGPVQAVSVTSTRDRAHPPRTPYDSRKPPYWRLLTFRQWPPPRPVNFYVIEHTKGLILLGTGQDSDSATDDTYFPGGLTGYLNRRFARFHKGAACRFPRTVQPPAGRLTGCVVRT